MLVTLSALSCISVADLSKEQQALTDAKGLHLTSIEWGRIVDVYDVDGNLVESDVLVDHLVTSSAAIELTANAVSQKESMFIQFPESSAEFSALFSDLKSNLQSVTRRGLLGEITYDMVGRNAAIRLNFNLPVDPDTVNSSSVQVLNSVSKDELAPFPVRYIVKNSVSSTTNQGAILIDPTVSKFEAAAEQMSANVIGYDASTIVDDYNLLVKIPTKVDFVNGVHSVLSSLDGTYGPSRVNTSEPVELIGVDNYLLIAAMRSGNDYDQFNGFMRDAIRPSLLGIQSATVSSHVLNGDGVSVNVIYSIDAASCADLAPKVGDVFEIVDLFNGNNLFTVVSVVDPIGPDFGVRCSSDNYQEANYDSPVAAKLSTRYSVLDSRIQACYLQITPEPVGSLPVDGILDDATVRVHFDEAIDPFTVRSMSSFVIVSPDNLANPDAQDVKERQAAWFRQLNSSEPVGDFIDRQRGFDYRPTIAGPADADSEYGGRVLFGEVVPSDGNRAFSITPTGGWQDADFNDGFDNFVVALRDGENGLKDMSGNQIKLPAFVAGNLDANTDIQLSVTRLNPPLRTRYFSLLCNSLDEDYDGLADWAGQVLATDFYGELSGRVPSRFTVAADNTQLSQSVHPVGNRTDGTAVNEPLNFAGAVVMNVYRPEDFGFGYEDIDEFNYSVEGWSWSPESGIVYDENFDRISLAMSHSFAVPDEEYTIVPAAPVYPQSGLFTNSFSENVLGFTPDGSSGINEIEMFDTTYYTRAINKYVIAGVEYLPWPEFNDKFVWRDTSFDQSYLGGRLESNGVPTDNYITRMGEWNWAPENRRYAPNFVPTVALPLQCRFRTYPQADTLGFNAFNTSLMMSPTNVPPKLPMFRIYSSGGQDATGTWQRVQPDQAGESGSVPVGGFLNGAATTEVGDDLSYWAAGDFSIEVSRMHSHWFDASGSINNGSIVGVVIEPSADEQPEGTSVTVEFRGSAAVISGNNPFENSTPLNDAGIWLGDVAVADAPFDFYGDFIGSSGTVSEPSAWTTDITDLEGRGYSFFQVRVSFKANTDLMLRPTLDGLGIVWTN